MRGFLGEKYKPTGLGEDRKTEVRGSPVFLRVYPPKPLDGPAEARHGALRASEGTWIVVT